LAAEMGLRLSLVKPLAVRSFAPAQTVKNPRKTATGPPVQGLAEPDLGPA
jgi:hypothetical protein